MRHPNVPRTSSQDRALRTIAAGVLALLLVAACSGEAPLPGDPLRLVSGGIPGAVVGEPYTHDLTPVGGLRPYDFALEEGRLPPGLALQGGTLIGTPTEVGRYEFTVSVADANLSSTYERFVLEVRELPLPRLDLAVPDTEVRDAVTLRGRVTDARNLRALRAAVDLHDAPVDPAQVTVRPSRDDVVVFHEVRDGVIAIDLAILGRPATGDLELFRLDLVTDEPVVLGLDLAVEFLYADRHHFAEERLGAPRPGDAGPSQGDPDAEPGDDATEDAAGAAPADERADEDADPPTDDPRRTP